MIGYVLSWMRARRYDLAPPWETRVLVLNYTGGEGNWGCQTTSVGLLSLISKAYRDIGRIDGANLVCGGTGPI